MLTNPVIITIALVEFVVASSKRHEWYRTREANRYVLSLKGDFIYDHWGMAVYCWHYWWCTGWRDFGPRFQSRRGPVAAILYLGVTLGSVALWFSTTDVQTVAFGVTSLVCWPY